MRRLLRRLWWFSIACGAVVLAYAWWQRRQHADAAAPEWPPFETGGRAAAPVDEPPAPTETPSGPSDLVDGPPPPAGEPTGPVPAPPSAGDEPDATWCNPVEGRCPDGFPVKVNVRSGIFHVPGGRAYERTRPDRCYRSAADAEADGYRASKT